MEKEKTRFPLYGHAFPPTSLVRPAMALKGCPELVYLLLSLPFTDVGWVLISSGWTCVLVHLAAAGGVCFYRVYYHPLARFPRPKVPGATG